VGDLAAGHSARTGRTVTSVPSRSRTVRSRACPHGRSGWLQPGSSACGEPGRSWPPPGVPCGMQAAQHVPHLADGLAGAGGGGGALGVDERGARVHDRGDELVFPARVRLAAVLAVARAVVHVAASGGTPAPGRG
jgi:hypothetical protein